MGTKVPQREPIREAEPPKNSEILNLLRISELFGFYLQIYKNTNSGQICAFWALLGNFGYFGHIWSNLVKSGQFCANLCNSWHFGHFWAFWAILGILDNSGHVGQIWAFWAHWAFWVILGKSGRFGHSGQVWAFWANLGEFGQICPDLPRFAPDAQICPDLPRMPRFAQNFTHENHNDNETLIEN